MPGSAQQSPTFADPVGDQNSGCLGDPVAGAAFLERLGPPDEFVQHRLGVVVEVGIVRHGLALDVAKADKGGNCRMTLSIKEMVSDVYSLFQICRTHQTGALSRLRMNTNARGVASG